MMVIVYILYKPCSFLIITLIMPLNKLSIHLIYILILHWIQIQTSLLNIGYNICFVVALVKTLRVVYIFWSVSPVKKV